MGSKNEKIFPPDLKVVKAASSKSSGRYLLVGFSIMLFFFVWALIYALLFRMQLTNIWWWVAVSILLIVIYVFIGVILKARRGLHHRELLTQRGKTVQASIVGHEVKENDEAADVYMVFYQFRPDFVVKHVDETSDQRFYRLALGSQVPVLFLEDDPTITGLVL
jgi:cytochrome bd-type quinol oxidase subunit 2